MKNKSKIGRNATCPCGSGEKYKKCCLSGAIKNSQSNPDFEDLMKAFDSSDFFSGEANNEYHSSVAKEFKPILKEYSAVEIVSIFASLSLNPEWQSSHYRLEKLISICLSFCKGNKKPNITLVQSVLDKASELFRDDEDPAESVFIETLWFEGEQYKINTGLWEGGIYQAQIFLDFFEQPELNNIKTTFIRNRLRAILKASDLIITSLGIAINEVGSESPIEEINYNNFNLDELIKSVRLTDFEESQFLPCIDVNHISELYKQELGESDLDESPFFIEKTSCTLLLPSSISACVRRQIVKFIRENYSNKHLDYLFFNYQAKKIYEINLFKKLPNISIVFHKIDGVDGWWYCDSAIEFDKGYVFHFIFLCENLSSIDSHWFNRFSAIPEKLSQYIQCSISNIKYKYIEKGNCNRGCTIMVLFGYGNSFTGGLDFDTGNQWMVSHMGMSDLDTISHDRDCAPHKVWRILESLEKLRKMKLELVNLNGFLNLYAYAKENNYCIVPHEEFQEVRDIQSIMLIIPLNCQSKVRQKVLKDTEKKKVYHPQQGFVNVVRGFADSLFTYNGKYNVYCPEKIDKNILQCVYVYDDCELWIEQTTIESVDFDFQYQCFEASLSWIEKIISTIKSFGLFIPDDLKVWNISFDFTDIGKIRDCPKPEKILSCFTNELISPVLYSTFESEFIDGLRQEDNISEQALILSLVSFICNVNHITNDENIKNILNIIIGSTSARYIHGFVARQYRERFIPDKAEPICIEQTDANNIKLDLGWSCRDRNLGNVIEGKKECTEYLNTLVESLWEKTKQILQTLNRELLILTVLSNMEDLSHQKSRWERTIKANLALQKDKINVYDVANNKISLLNEASLYSRLVIEMAICECPLAEGKKAGILDIQELMCFASLMYHMGGLSEEIHYEATEPKLTISAFGDVLYDHEFHDKLLEPYAKEVSKIQLNSNIDDYAKHFLEPEPIDAINHTLDDKFSNAWVDEFGFTIDDIREFIDSLEDEGFKREELIYQLSYQELLALFDSDRIEIAKAIVKALEI